MRFELRGGPFLRDILQALPERRQRGKQHAELLVDRRREEIALGAGGHQALGLPVRKPLRDRRRTRARQRNDFLAQDGGSSGTADPQMIAKTGHQQCRPHRHGRRVSRPATGGRRLGISGLRVESLIQGPACQTFDDRAGTSEVDLILLDGQIEPADEGLVPADSLAQRARRFVADADVRSAVELNRHVDGAQDVMEEPGHVRASADGRADAGQLGRHRIGLDGVLSKARAAGLLAVAGILPLDVQFLLVGIEFVDEVERELHRAFLVAEQSPLEQRLRDLLAGAWDRHGHSEITLDALVLADQDIEDHAVDRVVGAVVGDHPDLGRPLPEPIHAPFALLVASGVPRQIVVQDSIEVILQIDALGQAVGADQDEPASIRDERPDAFLALGGRETAGHRRNGRISERGTQVARDVVGGVDEPAEDDRVKATVQERLDLPDGALQLAVRADVDALRAAGEFQQTAARCLRAVFGVGTGTEVQGHGIIVV